MHDAGVIRQLLSPEEAALLAEDYTLHEKTYKSLFNGMSRPLLGTPEFEAYQHEYPEPLQQLLGKLAVLLEAKKPEPVSMTLKQIIAIRSASKPHRDTVNPSHTFVVVVRDGMDALYGGKMRTTDDVLHIIGGQQTHLSTGDALYINNTSRFTKRRPPHETKNAKDCMRFLISYAVNRSYLT